MMIAEVLIPVTYKALRYRVSKSREDFEINQVFSQYCADCGQVIIAQWPARPNMGNISWIGDSYRCPQCGLQPLKNIYRVNDRGRMAPIKMTLRLEEYKEHLTLKVYATCVTFSEDGTRVFTGAMQESVVFNARTKKAFFKYKNAKDGEVKIDIANPLETQFESLSLLSALRSHSLAWTKQRSEVQALLKKLRDRLEAKTKKIHGYGPKAMAMSAAHLDSGFVIGPLKNIAWRLAATDAPNASDIIAFREPAPVGREVQGVYCPNLSKSKFDAIIEECRKGLSYPQSLLKACGIEDKSTFRSLIAKRPIYAAYALERTISIFSDMNFIREIFLKFLDALVCCRKFHSNVGRYPYVDCYDGVTLSDKYARALKLIAKVKGEIFIRDMLLKLDIVIVRDIAQQFNQLTPGNKQAALSMPLTVKNIHDELTELLNRQKHKDYELNVPEHIINRLQMQKDRLKFFLPSTHYQLRDAGKELHNCVGSYAARVASGEECIVLMADDKGKLLVCMEVKGNRILQAKLYGNDPVYYNDTLNAEVIEWAKATGLKIDTHDIRQPETLRNAV